MKKKYTKPMIIIEDFSVNSTIAAGCEFKNGLLEQGACGYETRNGVVFLDTIEGCVYKQPDVNDALCYHVPTVDTNIFAS